MYFGSRHGQDYTALVYWSRDTIFNYLLIDKRQESLVLQTTARWCCIGAWPQTGYCTIPVSLHLLHPPILLGRVRRVAVHPRHPVWSVHLLLFLVRHRWARDVEAVVAGGDRQWLAGRKAKLAKQFLLRFGRKFSFTLNSFVTRCVGMRWISESDDAIW